MRAQAPFVEARSGLPLFAEKLGEKVGSGDTGPLVSAMENAKVKPSMVPGVKATLTYKVPADKTAPHVLPEAKSMAALPDVFASGYMIALMEWCCIEAMAPHLDEGEGSVGVKFDIAHTAPTPPGFTVTVSVELVKVEGKFLTFSCVAHDGEDEIGRGTHGRPVMNMAKFKEKVAQKAKG